MGCLVYLHKPSTVGCWSVWRSKKTTFIYPCGQMWTELVFVTRIYFDNMDEAPYMMTDWQLTCWYFRTCKKQNIQLVKSGAMEFARWWRSAASWIKRNTTHNNYLTTMTKDMIYPFLHVADALRHKWNPPAARVLQTSTQGDRRLYSKHWATRRL